jgi:hypothetical protein
MRIEMEMARRRLAQEKDSRFGTRLRVERLKGNIKQWEQAQLIGDYLAAGEARSPWPAL